MAKAICEKCGWANTKTAIDKHRDNAVCTRKREYRELHEAGMVSMHSCGATEREIIIRAGVECRPIISNDSLYTPGWALQFIQKFGRDKMVFSNERGTWIRLEPRFNKWECVEWLKRGPNDPEFQALMSYETLKGL